MFNKTRRTSVLIEPYKQLRFGLMFLFINLVFSSLIFGVFAYFLWDMYGALSVYFKLDEAQAMMTLEKFAQPAALGVTLVALFIATTLLISARYTHQIYGPMVSIRRFLDEVIAGKVPQPIALRSSDQLQDLAHRLNRLVVQLGVGGQQSRKLILERLDALLAGKKVEAIHLEDQDPLKEIAEKINALARK